MEPLFKVEIDEGRKMWYEDNFYALQKKWFIIFRLIFACYCGLLIIFMIRSWIKEGQIAWGWIDILAVIGFVLFLTCDRLIPFLRSLILQRRMRKHTGLPYIPTCKLFYEDYMVWTNPKKSGSLPYSEIAEVKTTKNMIIIVCSKDGCHFLVSKHGFVVGTPLAFEEFIKSKIAH